MDMLVFLRVAEKLVVQLRRAVFPMLTYQPLNENQVRYRLIPVNGIIEHLKWSGHQNGIRHFYVYGPLRRSRTAVRSRRDWRFASRMPPASSRIINRHAHWRNHHGSAMARVKTVRLKRRHYRFLICVQRAAFCRRRFNDGDPLPSGGGP